MGRSLGRLAALLLGPPALRRCLLPAAEALPEASPSVRRSFRAGPACTTPRGGSGQATAVLVDAENVRGASGFRLSHRDVWDAAAAWSDRFRLGGRVALLWDHGREPDALWTGGDGMAAVFAGPCARADDVLATDALPFFLQCGGGGESDCTKATVVPGVVGTAAAAAVVVVVTADKGLIRRCFAASASAHHFSPGNRVEIVPPQWLLHDWELLALEEEVQGKEGGEPPAPTSAQERGPWHSWEVRLACEWCEAELLLLRHRPKQQPPTASRRHHHHHHFRPRPPSKLHKALQRRQQQLRASLRPSLAAVLSRLAHLWLLTGEGEKDKEGDDPNPFANITSRDRAVLREVRSRCRGSSSPSDPPSQLLERSGGERTRHRAAEAEQLRLELLFRQGGGGEESGSAVLAAAPQSPVEAYVRHFERRKREQPPQPNGIACSPAASSQVLRLVAVSQAPLEGNYPGELVPAPVADGDFLVHVGNFAPDSSTDSLDRWLSRLPHRHKVVVRGERDPVRATFARSRALYVTQPTRIELSGLRFAIIPFLPRREWSNRIIPPRGEPLDVLVSHEPPWGILDRCHATGRATGSLALRRGLERRTGAAAPALVLCGRVSDSRGAVWQGFASAGGRETLVVNAAVPTQPAALWLGPTVVQLDRAPEKRGGTQCRAATLLEMERGYEHLNGRDHAFFESNGEKDCQLLLAVDLGLRTGLCLFDNSGQLLRYADQSYDSATALERGIHELLRQWETEEGCSISRIALEGSDHELLSLWARAVGDRSLLIVTPDQWRGDLLSGLDRATGTTSKLASREFAHWIIQTFETNPPESPTEVSTDCAEALMVGLHVARRLGWIPMNLLP